MSANQKLELPVLERYPVIAGALTGLVLRLVYSGKAGTDWSAMMGSFIYGAPVLIGMLTVYLAERQSRRSWPYYVWAPVLANLLFVAGALVVLFEGLICALVIVPMFSVLGMIGGVTMGAICRLTNHPRATIRCAAAAPILLGFVAPLIPTPPVTGEVSRSVRIDAPPSVVWRQINDIREIRDAEIGNAWAMRIGVPPPVSGMTRMAGTERVRTSNWGKRVHFDEIIQDWQPDRQVRWTYRFYADSFPPNALDDHVVIGGHYFDLVDTSYSLVPEDNGRSTRLSTKVHYRIATQFNFYAAWVAKLLIGNLSEHGLALYKERSERATEAKP